MSCLHTAALYKQYKNLETIKRNLFTVRININSRNLLPLHSSMMLIYVDEYT